MTRLSLSPNPQDRALDGCCRMERSYRVLSHRGRLDGPCAAGFEAELSSFRSARTVMLLLPSCLGDCVWLLGGLGGCDGIDRDGGYPGVAFVDVLPDAPESMEREAPGIYWPAVGGICAIWYGPKACGEVTLGLSLNGGVNCVDEARGSYCSLREAENLVRESLNVGGHGGNGRSRDGGSLAWLFCKWSLGGTSDRGPVRIGANAGGKLGDGGRRGAGRSLELVW